MTQFVQIDRSSRIRLGSGSRTLTERCVVRLSGEDARVVTIVRLRPDAVADPVVRRGFLDKAQVLLDLHEPTVAATLSFGCSQEHFIVREFIDGLSLRQLLERARVRLVQMPSTFACQVVLQQCTSLLAVRRALREQAPAFARCSFAATLRSIVIDRDTSARWVDPLGLDNPSLPDPRVADPAEEETRALLGLLYELCTGRALAPTRGSSDFGGITPAAARELPEEFHTLSILGLDFGGTAVTGLGALATRLAATLTRLESPEPTWMEPLLGPAPRSAVSRPSSIAAFRPTPVAGLPSTPVAGLPSTPVAALTPTPIGRRRRVLAMVGILIAALGSLALGVLWKSRPDQTRATVGGRRIARTRETSQAQRERLQPQTQPPPEPSAKLPPAAVSPLPIPAAPEVERARPASASPAAAGTATHRPRRKKEPSSRTSDTADSTPRNAGPAVEEDKPDLLATGAEYDAAPAPPPEPRLNPEPAPPPTSAPPKTMAAPPAGLDREQIRRIVAAHRAEIGTCYERARLTSPNVAGTVTVRIVLAADGKVVSADVASDTTGSPLLQGCLGERIHAWHFPAFGRRSTVIYPFRFE